MAGQVTQLHCNAQNLASTKLNSNWTYDKLGRVSSQSIVYGTSNTLKAEQALTYFGNDEPATMDVYLGSADHKQYAYTYDARHELTGVGENLLPNAFTAAYGYGSGGRLTSVNESAASLAGGDVEPRDVTYSYQGADPEEVTSLSGSFGSGSNAGSGTYASYTYDAAGNQLTRCYGTYSDGSCSGALSVYTYDAKNQLRRAVAYGTSGLLQGSEVYWYDRKGNRIALVKYDQSGNKITSGPPLYVFQDGFFEGHYDGSGNAVETYSYAPFGGGMLRVDRTAATGSADLEYIFHGLGDSTLAAVDQNGTINAAFDYAPFGELIETVDASNGNESVEGHRRRLNDKYQDEISDLGYYGARSL